MFLESVPRLLGRPKKAGATPPQSRFCKNMRKGWRPFLFLVDPPEFADASTCITFSKSLFSVGERERVHSLVAPATSLNLHKHMCNLKATVSSTLALGPHGNTRDLFQSENIKHLQCPRVHFLSIRLAFKVAAWLSPL